MAARAEPQTVVPLVAHRRSRAVPVLVAVAAVAACAALALGLWGGADHATATMRVALERAQAASAVLSDPDARTVDLRRVGVQARRRRRRAAVLVLDEIEQAPDGKTYEVWLSDGGAPAPAGLFDGGGIRDVVPVEGTVDAGSVVLVTVEDAGASTRPPPT